MSGIEIVGSTGYQAFLEHVKESEECYTHLGQVHSPIHGTFSGYVKFYPDQFRNSKGLVNEACGHLLAAALDIPVPRYGMLLVLERARLVEAHSALRNLIGSDPYLTTWVTEQARGVPVVERDERTIHLLRIWKSLPALIAFDDWVLNSDRSLENLVCDGRSRFTAIDHGHIFGGLRWDSHLLTPDLPIRHPFLAALWQGNPPPQIKSQILEAAERHGPALTRCRPELEVLLGNLLDSQEDRKQVLEFLEHRAARSYDRLRSSLGMLT